MYSEVSRLEITFRTLQRHCFLYQREYVCLGKEFELTRLPFEALNPVMIIVVMMMVSDDVCMCIFLSRLLSSHL